MGYSCCFKKLIICCGCILIASCGSEENSNTNPIENTIQLIQDPQFEGGFKLTPLSPETVKNGGGFDNTYVDTLGFRKEGSQPIWQLAQWGSDYSLADVEPQQSQDGSRGYENKGKKVVLYPDNSLLLEVNSSQEYDNPRKPGEQWPHLLISQNFRNAPNIGKVNGIIFSMQLKLVKAENRMTEQAYDPAKHTAHALFYLTIKNKNKNSPDYNQKIWFGIRSYDYRYPKLDSTENISWDIATSRYIYQVPTVAVWGDINFNDGQWHKAEANLKPLILEALETLREKGVFKATTPNDLQITGMNFGWEVPGTFDAAVRVKDISLEVVTLKKE